MTAPERICDPEVSGRSSDGYCLCGGGAWEQLTNLRSFFQNDYSDFFALFFFELF